MGKYVKRKKSVIKPVLVLASVVILLLGATFGTLAYLSAESTQAINTFTPSRVTSSVVETFENNIKKDVSIKNTGDTTAYIRAAVVVTWQDENGNVYGTVPANGDYEITYNLYDQTNPVGKWELGTDGFYYWTSPVAPDATTGVLITEAKPLKAAPAEGYTLCIEILGSGIQSVPTSVVTNEWSSGVSGVVTDEGETKDQLIVKVKEG